MGEFILRLPFRLPPDQKFDRLDKSFCTNFQGLKVTLGEQSGRYFFSVATFPDEISAQVFIDKLWAGLMWAMLNRGLSPELDLTIQPIWYSEDPEVTAKNIFGSAYEPGNMVDSLIDGSRPAIYLAGKDVRFLTGNDVNIIQGRNPEGTWNCISEVFAYQNSDQVIKNEKLKLSLELYNAFFREATVKSRFLTLTMALEVLLPIEKKSADINSIIDIWILDIDERLLKASRDSEEWFALESLRNEIRFRKEVSIRKKISRLISNEMLSLGEERPYELAREAVAIYDKRSRLVHNGSLPDDDLSQSVERLKELLGKTLKSIFLRVSS